MKKKITKEIEVEICDKCGKEVEDVDLVNCDLCQSDKEIGVCKDCYEEIRAKLYTIHCSMGLDYGYDMGSFVLRNVCKKCMKSNKTLIAFKDAVKAMSKMINKRGK